MALDAPVFNKNNLYQMSRSELVSRLDPQGHIADIAEALEETNEILLDMTFKESNILDGYLTTIRTGLPTAYWKQINRGVPASKSTTAQIKESSGMMEAQSRVDPKLIELNGNTKAFRASEERPFLEAMNQTMAHELFYGDATAHKEGFNGFECRYNTIQTSKALSAKNVIDAKGTGTKLASIYVVAWGDNVFGFYPKGSTVGLHTSDLGLQLVQDDDGNYLRNYITIYNWDMGLVVRDWRYVARICNINVEDLKNGVGVGTPDVRQANTTNLVLLLQQALDLIPRQGNSHIAIYMNGDVFSAFNTLAARSAQNVIEIEQALNRHGEQAHWRTFMGYPLRRCDQLKTGEAQVK